MVGDDPVVTEYSEAAKDYDEKWSFYVEATTRETLKRLALPATGHLLDVGCQTGELLSSVASVRPNLALAGIDPAQEMLAVAHKKLAGSADLRVGYANALPWPNGCFDVVVSCNVFHYITHPLPALKEMARVLRSGGELVITDWCDDYLACRLCNIYLRLTQRAYYKTYRQRECLGLLQEAGYAVSRMDRWDSTEQRWRVYWFTIGGRRRGIGRREGARTRPQRCLNGVAAFMSEWRSFIFAGQWSCRWCASG